MNKVYFHLPGAFTLDILYNTLINIYKNEKHKFYDYVEIGSIYDTSSLSIWSGGKINLKFTSLPPKEIKELYDKNNISISLEESNTLLDKNDIYSSISNYFTNTYHEEKNEIIIGSDILKELVDDLYPKFKKISSTYKFLTKSETLDELNKGYDRVELNYTLNHDFDFLYNLTNEQKNKIEIILNPTCNNFCGRIKEHYDSISYDMIHRDMTSRNFRCEWQNKNCIERLKLPHTIKNDELIDKYIKKGFSNFKIINQSLYNQDIIYILTYYLIKPEYYLDIIYILSNTKSE